MNLLNSLLRSLLMEGKYTVELNYKRGQDKLARCGSCLVRDEQ